MVEPYISIMSPGSSDADADRLRRRVDGAGDDRRALGKPRLRRGRLRHMAGDVGRPQQLGSCSEVDDAGGKLVAPVQPSGEVERASKLAAE